MKTSDMGFFCRPPPQVFPCCLSQISEGRGDGKGGKKSLTPASSVRFHNMSMAGATDSSLGATPQRWLTSERERCHPDKKPSPLGFVLFLLLCLLFPSASCSRDFREKGWIGSGNERRKREEKKTSSTFNGRRRRRAPQFSSSSSNSFRFCNKFEERKKRRGEEVPLLLLVGTPAPLRLIAQGFLLLLFKHFSYFSPAKKDLGESADE